MLEAVESALFKIAVDSSSDVIKLFTLLNISFQLKLSYSCCNLLEYSFKKGISLVLSIDICKKLGSDFLSPLKEFAI